MLEVNPRASRTVPFVSKATGLPLAKIAARVMAGRKLSEQGVTAGARCRRTSRSRRRCSRSSSSPESDPILGPEMKSTGEVMGTGPHLRRGLCQGAVRLGRHAAGKGVCFISVRDRDKPGAVDLARRLIARGFELVATERHRAR